MINKILIGVEDSKYADAAAKYGFNLAGQLGAHVGLVNIIEPSAAHLTSNNANEILGVPLQGMGGIDNTDLEIYKVQTQLSENIIQQVSENYGGKLEVTHFSEYGSTGEGILTCANEFKADLIIVGTHHRSGLDRLFSHSIAEYIVKNSRIPVLVVPSKE